MASGKPILWVKSKISKTDAITDENFNKWYSDIHIQDVLITSGVNSAYRYKSLDPTADKPYLAIYPSKSVEWLNSDEFKAINCKSDYFPGPTHNCHDFAEFDVRVYEYLHDFEAANAKSGPSNLIISAALTPAKGTDADFDSWYKEEHYSTLSNCKGYVRTRRYKFVSSVTGTPPTFLALHEFEGETLPEADLQKTSETPWAKKVMGSLEGSEIGFYELIGKWGDE